MIGEGLRQAGIFDRPTKSGAESQEMSSDGIG
jgi:hypothetical protein